MIYNSAVVGQFEIATSSMGARPHGCTPKRRIVFLCKSNRQADIEKPMPMNSTGHKAMKPSRWIQDQQMHTDAGTMVRVRQSSF